MSVTSSLQCEAVPVPMAAPGPLVVELIPAPKPLDVARACSALPHLIFLDSAESHPDRGRFSYISAAPVSFYQKRSADAHAFLSRLALQLESHAHSFPPGLPPFRGGFAGLFGYGLGRTFEQIPTPRIDEFEVPDLAIGAYDWVISFDHQTNQAWLLSTGWPQLKPDAIAVHAAKRLKEVLHVLHGQAANCQRLCSQGHMGSGAPLSYASLTKQYPLPDFPGVTSNFHRSGYEAAVARAIEYTHAGDCFQVNLSQRLLAPLREHPFELYTRLRLRNPAPFAAYFDLGEFQILSASPERFLRVVAGEVETRPIKGTRPRGRTAHEDAALIADLTSSTKDRAENIMIVDLLRNDLGRVCEFGSVRVPRLCEVESYNFVHHLVSEVRGRLRSRVGPLDLLAATFPGGSVTGAPKVRAMEIIAELEPTARGPYCGCLGSIGFDGSMDSNILIRTFTAGRGWLQFPVGGGIVADSQPRTEYDETLVKAAGLLRALDLT